MLKTVTANRLDHFGVVKPCKIMAVSREKGKCTGILVCIQLISSDAEYIRAVCFVFSVYDCLPACVCATRASSAPGARRKC